MAHRLLPTLSELPTAMECVGSCVLPRSWEPAGDRAARGQAIHAFVGDAAQDGAQEALDAVPPEHQDFAETVLEKLERLQMPGARYEVAVKYAVDTGLAWELGVNLQRNYGPRGPRDIVGALDIAAVNVAQRHVAVADFKTGWTARNHVAPATRNYQVRVGAMALARAHGADSATVAVLRISDTGFVDDTDVADMDEGDFLLLEDELRFFADRVDAAADQVARGEAPETRPGPWCQYCKAYARCPEKERLMHLAVTSADDLLTKQVQLLMTPETAPRAYELWRAVDVLAGKLGAEIHRYANAQPIMLRDGRLFGPHPVEAKVLDPHITLKVVEEELGKEAALEAMSFKASMAGLERAAKAAKRKVAPTVRELTAKISAAGGLAVVEKTRLEEHKP